MAFANVQAAAGTGGVLYADAVPVTSTEADLFNQPIPYRFDPVAVPSEHEVLLAIIQLRINGGPATNSTYIVLQTDLGDGVWVDVSWIVWTGTSGTATFCMSSGPAGGITFLQTRAAGTSPGTSGTNKIPLGGRIRFVGKVAYAFAGLPSLAELMQGLDCD